MLRDAALSYLARFAATEIGVLRVLNRRIDRWARATPDSAEAVAQARQAAQSVVAKLKILGVVNDATFAANRARSLTRSGRSRRFVAAHLAAKGVPEAAARAALPADDATELAAALAYAKRRRMGPFRAEPADVDQQRTELARLARAGFPAGIAARALRLDRSSAEDQINQLRQGE